MSDDPYKYFRIEAREILDALVPRVLRLEDADVEQTCELYDQLMRLAHTLKGAAGVVGLAEIARRAHAIEDLLDDAGDDGADAPVEQILELADAIDSQLRGLGAAEPRSSATHESTPQPEAGDEQATAGDERPEILRVGIREFDALAAGLVQTGVEIAGLDRDVARLERADQLLSRLDSQLDATGRADGYGLSREQLLQRNRQLLEQLRETLSSTRHRLSVRSRRMTQELEELRSITTHLRLVPASRLETILERAVRDAAKACDKDACLRFVGAEVRLDARVLAGVREALLHLVRNAVAHGIEGPRERQSQGKPPRGQVEVRIERHGDRVCITCTDDGAGIDTLAVAKKAAAQGILPQDEVRELSDDQAVALLLSHSRFSTATSVDSVSGRGLGLGIVRKAIASLQGHVGIQTTLGQGTEVELVVPVSTAWMRVLRLRGRRHETAIPLDAVFEVRSVHRRELVETAHGFEIEFDGQTIPFGLLDMRMSPGQSAPAVGEAWTVAVVEAGTGRVALGAHSVLGTSEVVVRPIPTVAAVDHIVSGAYLDEHGQPRLVVDPVAAARALGASSRPAFADFDAPRAARLLAIDDSMTTRMLLQSILEAAGYDVTLASSAEEGMELAEDADYDVFLVDVEMPGMNGFEFVERTRRDPALGQVPAILLTSRSEPEHRRRGLDAGASAYIVKGEFAQRDFLATIERLVAKRRADERAEVNHD